ncbi:cyclin G [Phlebotomus argentipes]|uniref:cyclin G n=1 Tax=Phlebotomus argentipes TaxID=94469 RepID=UPI002892A9CF|nr:cyclin G [Phlebotomus argentipes]
MSAPVQCSVAPVIVVTDSSREMSSARHAGDEEMMSTTPPQSPPPSASAMMTMAPETVSVDAMMMAATPKRGTQRISSSTGGRLGTPDAAVKRRQQHQQSSAMPQRMMTSSPPHQGINNSSSPSSSIQPSTSRASLSNELDGATAMDYTGSNNNGNGNAFMGENGNLCYQYMENNVINYHLQSSTLGNLRNEQLYPKLEEALALEEKFHANLYLPPDPEDNEITVGARDGAAHVLRCLKMWYDLPPDVLFAALNLVDRFLARMRARPKHMACISVGSLYLCVTQFNMAKIDAADLVAISQCRCTAGDLERMAAIISNKLGVQPSTIPVTALTFVRIYYHMFRNAAFHLGLGDFYDKSISLADLELRLEILICDALCVSVRASELALVLVCTQMDAHVNSYVNSANPMISGLVDFAIELQKMAKIPDPSFFRSHSLVVRTLTQYNAQKKMPYRQRLVWKLSSRTMRVLRPTHRLNSHLPTIDEHKTINNSRSLPRHRSCSFSSDDDDGEWARLVYN